MNIDVAMPQLGETVAEGTVIRWLRQVGDVLADQEPLLEIATDKVDTEVPSPGAGTLLEILVGEDTTVAVGTRLAVIGAPADTQDPAPPDPTPGAGASAAHRPRHVHSPRVRRLARESGVSLEAVDGTGPGGRVTPADVAAAVEPQPAPVRAVDPPRPEQRDTVPPPDLAAATPGPEMSTAIVEIDVTAALTALESADGVTLIAVVAHALVNALRGERTAGRFGAGSATHLAVTVDTERGVVAPVVRDADDLTLRGLGRRLRDAAARAHEGVSAPDEAVGATVTVHDSASRGLLVQTPLLPAGQPLAVAVGAVTERPAVIRTVHGDRAIGIRSVVQLALTCDSAAVDGAAVGRVLTRVKRRVEAADTGLDVS